MLIFTRQSGKRFGDGLGDPHRWISPLSRLEDGQRHAV